MTKKLMGIIAAVAVLACSGCIESTSVLSLNKDGSGAITVTEFYSPQITGMMEGMGSMTKNMAEGAGAESADSAEFDMFKESINQKLEKMGPGVKLVKDERKTNGEGWKGYEATFSFDDINKINLAIEDQAKAGPGQDESDASSDAYTFKFTPGSPAKLEIIPAPVPELTEETTAEMDDQTEQMAAAGQQMGASMMQAMAPMMKGMRLAFIVEVNGDIQETNAKYRSNDKPNRIVVMDVPMDKVLENSEAMSLLSAGDDSGKHKLAKMDIEGVSMEEPGKTLSVSFK